MEPSVLLKLLTTVAKEIFKVAHDKLNPDHIQKALISATKASLESEHHFNLLHNC